MNHRMNSATTHPLKLFTVKRSAPSPIKTFSACLVLSLAFVSTVLADKVTLIAGGKGADGGLATQAKVAKPFAVCFDKEGNMYIGQFGNKGDGQLVRKVDTHGTITTIGGTGIVGSGGDGGPATKGEFNFIHDIVFGPDGNLYIADSFNRKVRKIDLKTGIINTIKGCRGGRSIALDSKGNLYIADGSSLRVRSPDGTMKVLLDATHLGGAESPLAANPKHLGIDAQDNVLICDEQHPQLRKYLPAEGKLITLMGDGKSGTAGIGGPPAQAKLSSPHGVLFHNGAIYVADSMNDRVLKISAE